MSDLTSIQAAALATEITLAKNYAITSLNTATTVRTDTQTLETQVELIKTNFNKLLDALIGLSILSDISSTLKDISFGS